MRKSFFVIPAMFVLAAGAGCTKQVTESREEVRGNGEGTERKRPSMPSKAFLGEWRGDNGRGENITYFVKEAPGKHLIITTVNSQGSVWDLEYAITSENTKDRILEVHQWKRKERDETKAAQSEMGDKTSWPHFKFSEDMNTVEIWRISGSGELTRSLTMSETINYVGEKTEP